MGGNISSIRKKILENTDLPLTTVPIYQTAAEIGLRDMNLDDIINNLKKNRQKKVSVLLCFTVLTGKHSIS